MSADIIAFRQSRRAPALFDHQTKTVNIQRLVYGPAREDWARGTTSLLHKVRQSAEVVYPNSGMVTLILPDTNQVEIPLERFERGANLRLAWRESVIEIAGDDILPVTASVIQEKPENVVAFRRR